MAIKLNAAGDLEMRTHAPKDRAAALSKSLLNGLRSRNFLKFVLALIAAALVCSPTQAQVSSFLLQKSAHAADLNAQLEDKGVVPIIIEFAVPELPPLPSGDFSADGDFFGAAKTRIAVSQDAILQDHFGSAQAPRPGQDFRRVVQRMDITPMIAVNVTRAELEALAADPRVRRIHENKRGTSSLLQVVPGLAMTGVDGGFARGATGGGRAVAIVDTGVLATHEFLAGRVVAEACFSTPFVSAADSLCPNSTAENGPGTASPLLARCIVGTRNLCFHGTLVAGIAAGNNFSAASTWSDGEPFYGVAKNADIVAVRAFHRNNNSLDCGALPAPCMQFYDSDLVAALNWIAQNAVNLPNGGRLAAVNMSLGNGAPTSNYCDDHVLKGPIDTLRALDIPTIISSGNDSSRTGVSRPACISTAFAIGSTSKTWIIAPQGNIGPQVVALGYGENVLSSSANPAGDTSNYGRSSGTSLAAPQVAGAIAALKSACPSTPIISDIGITGRLFNDGVPIIDTRSGGQYTRKVIVAGGIPGTLGCTRNPNTRDTSGNHKSDIIWRSSNGDIAVWSMNGRRVIHASPIGHPVDATGWSIAGVRDFDFNHKADLLWRAPDGSVYIEFLNDWLVTSTALVSGPVPFTWSVVGTPDVNGDGNGDILWRSSSGTVATWIMSGNNVAANTSYGTVPNSWSIVGTGDFNGDGRVDILWRSSSGDVAMWLMDGVSVLSSVGVGQVPMEWSIIGTGDFNGNGRFDILWRSSSGDVAVWLMNGAAISASVGISNIPMEWSVSQTGDFDGDGKSDLLWRRLSDGFLSIWFMDRGPIIASVKVRTSEEVGAVPTFWQVQNANSN